MIDPTWSTEHQRFRTEVREWLIDNLREVERDFPTSHFDGPAALPGLLEWERRLRAARYNAVSWPTEFGGQGYDHLRALIFGEEYFSANAPRRINYPALGLLGPTLMAVGSSKQRLDRLPRMLSCEEIWCQGFSEPGSGSDLANLSTRAVREGDHYRITGQKVWVSNAHFANRIFMLARTGEPGSRHKGLSYFLVDLKAAGVEVRPIRQVHGAALFAEVFFDQVRVPESDRVGAENEGWKVANATLKVERDASRYPMTFFQNLFDELMIILRATGAIHHDAVRIEAARLQAGIRRYQWNAYAASTSDRDEVGQLGSMSKLVRSNLQMGILELGMQALGSRHETGSEELPEGVGRDWHERYWYARASRIYAGTNEIQRNIIGERLLGLPREPR
jgi:alkylation response protein AidB-like acyl-CoA dehydrogenase